MIDCYIKVDVTHKYLVERSSIAIEFIMHYQIGLHVIYLHIAVVYH
jgi:hypothetical protein